MDRARDVLIYLPGMPRNSVDNADGVAEVVARTLSVRRQGSYRAVTGAAPAPRGLRVAKTVLGPDDVPALDVYELDYRDRLATVRATRPGGGAQPGGLGSLGVSLAVLVKTIRALRRPAKSSRCKAQLLLACMAAAALVLVTLGAFAAEVGWLRWVPDGIKDLGTDDVTPTRVAMGYFGLNAVVWVALRRHVRLVADHVRETVRYLKADRHRQTVVRTLDEAVDGLLDDGFSGRIHVLGYSFGSLVALDALLPTGGATGRDRVADAVTSLTTLGCPVDAVRLFYPDYFAGRASRRSGLPWTNIFIAADLFGSNVANRDDAGIASADDVTSIFRGVDPTSLSYTDEQLSWLNVLSAKGFRMHGGYWGTPDEASCFEMLVDGWVPLPMPAVPKPRSGGVQRKTAAKAS